MGARDAFSSQEGRQEGRAAARAQAALVRESRLTLSAIQHRNRRATDPFGYPILPLGVQRSSKSFVSPDPSDAAVMGCFRKSRSLFFASCFSSGAASDASSCVINVSMDDMIF